MPPLLIALLMAFAIGAVVTPIVRQAAHVLHLVDQPDGKRKLHGSGTALGGGLAVLISWLATLAILCILPRELGSSLHNVGRDPQQYFTWSNIGIIVAAITICVVGLIDDRWRLRGRQKLFGQLVAVAIVLSCGVLIQRVRVFDWRFELGILAIPFTAFWLLGAVNSLNLIDGADGMAGTVGAIICGTIALLASFNHNPAEAAIAATLCGAILGFLIFNLPPASIFLGDAGSMLVGMVIGVLAIRTSLKGAATLALVTPLAILTVPIFDSFVAILRRRLTGRSIYATDRAHLHHCLLRCGLTHRSMLFCVALLCVIPAVGALVSVYLQNELVALVGAAMVVVVLVATRVFGYAELSLLAHRLFAFGGSLLPIPAKLRGSTRRAAVRLQGSRNWEQIWDAVTEFAERHELCHVKLDVNVAWLHEGYHAVWERRDMPDAVDLWMTRIPIVAHDRNIGRLEITGLKAKESLYNVLNMLAELLDSLEPQFHRLAAVDESNHEATLPPPAQRLPRPQPATVSPSEETTHKAE